MKTKQKRQLQTYILFCYECKEHFEYSEYSKADALKKFYALGHSDTKVKFMRKDIGRGQIKRPTKVRKEPKIVAKSKKKK